MRKRNKQTSISRTKSTIVGKVRYHRKFPSKYLRYSRDIIVWVPPSYVPKSAKRYPVLYMQDGQNLFDPATSFAGVDWRVDQTATALIHAEKMEEIIVVGIYNSPDRLQEYSGSATGLNYSSFIVEELKPFIDKKYRTKKDPANTAAMGSSMGGLISFLLTWWHPEVFSQSASLSGSFLWNKNALPDEVEAYDGSKKNIRLYLDVGSKETMLIGNYEQMVGILESKGFVEGVDFEHHLIEGGEHNEGSWGDRLALPLYFLFGTDRNEIPENSSS